VKPALRGPAPGGGWRPPATFAIHDEGGGVLRLVGEFDVGTAPEVQARLATHRGPAILDLHEVTFIDSTGLRTLLGATRERGRDEPLVLRAPSPAVRRLIELAALTEQLAFEPEAPDEPH
jgi:anti-anti-sigma factor